MFLFAFFCVQASKGNCALPFALGLCTAYKLLIAPKTYLLEISFLDLSSRQILISQ